MKLGQTKAKKIKEFIIRILQSREYSSEEITKILEIYQSQTIKEAKLFRLGITEHIKEKNIIYVEQFLNQTIQEASKDTGVTTETIKNRIKTICLKLIELIEERRKEVNIIEKIKQTEHRLIELINKIEKNPKLLQYLKEDIICSENSKWKNSRLFLDIEEIIILRNYIRKNIDHEILIRKTDEYKVYKQINNIYTNLNYYIKRLEYKKIVNQNYYELKSINLINSEQNSLKRNNILCVSDILEYTEEELETLPILGEKTLKKILEELDKRNIHLLCHKEIILANLKEENANIKVKQKQYK